MSDFYRVLDISPESTQKEIKQRFRKLSKLYHPDNVRDKSDHELVEIAVEKFKQINEAYQILSNPKKREAYDKEMRNKDYWKAGYERYKAASERRKAWREQTADERRRKSKYWEGKTTAEGKTDSKAPPSYTKSSARPSSESEPIIDYQESIPASSNCAFTIIVIVGICLILYSINFLLFN